MKKFREIYIAVRDFMHIVGFFTLAYWLIGKLEIDFYLWQKIVLGLVLSVLGYGLGHSYEGLKFMLFGDPTSNADGNRSWLGFTLGAYLILFIPGIKFINTYMFYTCLVLVIADFIYSIYNKNKKKNGNTK